MNLTGTPSHSANASQNWKSLGKINEIDPASSRRDAITDISRLLELPNEILIKIIEFSGPDEFERLSITCKQIFNLSQQTGLIRHHNYLRKTYTVWKIKTERSNPHVKPSFKHPVELINDISYDSNIANYVKDVDFDDVLNRQNVVVPENVAIIERVRRAIKELRETGRLKKLLDDSPYFSEERHHLDWLHDTILSKSFDDLQGRLAIVFLLTLLPNLSSLQLPSSGFVFTPYRTGPDFWGDNSKTQKEGFDQRLLWNIVGQKAKELNASLGMLENVVIGRIIGPTSLKHVAPFALLPRIKKLKLGALEAGVQVQDAFEWPAENAQSPLQSLVVEYANLDPNTLSKFLDPMICLRTLVWLQIGGRVRPTWDGGRAAALIMASPAQHTLEKLQLSIGERDRCVAPVASLKDFKKLVNLKINIELLRGYPRSAEESENSRNWSPHPLYRWPKLPIRPLVDILPASIERVVVGYRETGITDEEIAGLLDGLPSVPENLPSLREVCISRLCIGWKQDQIGFSTTPIWSAGSG